MAKSNAFAGMVQRRAKKTAEVNPTFSLKSAPKAVPSNGGKQVNPTWAANKSQSAVSKMQKSRVNPTFAVANASMETSKGKSGPTLVKAKSRVTKAIATAKNPQPVKMGITKSNKGGAGIKGLKTPTRNIKGGVGKGRANSGPAKNHPVKSAKDVTAPTRNEMAPFGPNGTAKAPMTVSRLKKLGY